MISVKNEVSQLDRQEDELNQSRKLNRNCLRLWRESLQAVEEYVFPLFPEAAKRAEEDWRQVHTCLDVDAPADILHATPRMVERVLHNYAQEGRRVQSEELGAVRSILAVMAAAADSARTRTDSYGTDFQGVCQTLNRLVDLQDPDDLRRQLRQESVHLRECVKHMVEESEASLQTMEADLAEFRARLAVAEAAAATDSLTGLANRRELERQLEERVQKRKQFSALLFDLDEFKSINDRFGHGCGDQVLRQFAAILSEQVRPGDVVARWGGDEFLVLFDCPLKDALRRSQQISARLSRRYELEWNGKKVSIGVNASSGVVEHTIGETAEELFQRADQAMYAVKSQRSAQRAG